MIPLIWRIKNSPEHITSRVKWYLPGAVGKGKGRLSMEYKVSTMQGDSVLKVCWTTLCPQVTRSYCTLKVLLKSIELMVSDLITKINQKINQEKNKQTNHNWNLNSLVVCKKNLQKKKYQKKCDNFSVLLREHQRTGHGCGGQI